MMAVMGMMTIFAIGLLVGNVPADAAPPLGGGWQRRQRSSVRRFRRNKQKVHRWLDGPGARTRVPGPPVHANSRRR